MSSSFTGDRFGGDRFGGRQGGMSEGWPGTAVWEAMDKLRGQFENRAEAKTAHGDVRAAVLALLAEKPMHGYQIIQQIEERSGGAWKPTPGSVYPTLQLLADEGLVNAEESDGRKMYSLTDEGRRAADSAGDRSAPWGAPSARNSGRTGGLAKAGIDLAQATAQVVRTGNQEQVKQAAAVLDDARRRLYSILAQE